jgi:hypothetical protein
LLWCSESIDPQIQSISEVKVIIILFLLTATAGRTELS